MKPLKAGDFFFESKGSSDWNHLGKAADIKLPVKQKNVQFQVHTVEIDVWQWIIMTYPRRYG